MPVAEQLLVALKAYAAVHKRGAWTALAEKVGMPLQTFHDKVTGKQPFTLPEAERVARAIGFELELRATPGETP